MSIQLALFICLVLIGVISFVTYNAGKKVSSRIIKYIPVIATAFGIGFFYVKINFIPYQSHVYEQINDIIAIIILGTIFGISLLGAIILDIKNRRKGKLQN